MRELCVQTEKFTIYIGGNIHSIKTHDSESRGQEEAAILCETKIMRPLRVIYLQGKPLRKSLTL